MTARPNILLIAEERLCLTQTSLYGNERPTTPNLERLAAKAIVCDNALEEIGRDAVTQVHGSAKNS